MPARRKATRAKTPRKPAKRAVRKPRRYKPAGTVAMGAYQRYQTSATELVMGTSPYSRRALCLKTDLTLERAAIAVLQRKRVAVVAGFNLKLKHSLTAYRNQRF